MGSGYSLYPLPCLFACDPPCPEPEGQGSRSGQTPVETNSVVAERPSQPATRHNAIASAGASTRRSGRATMTRSSPDTLWAWSPHVARHPGEHPVVQRSQQQPASAPRLHQRMPPVHRCATPHSKLHCRIPTSCLCARPRPVSPRERRIAHGRLRARAAKTGSSGFLVGSTG